MRIRCVAVSSVSFRPPDLSTFTVKSPDDLLKILKVGQKQRKVGATKMNEGSSRSHSILTITIESSEKSKDKEGNETVHYKVGKLNMVDLAGSERQKKTEAQGDRLDEAKSINWSLTVLGNWYDPIHETSRARMHTYSLLAHATRRPLLGPIARCWPPLSLAVRPARCGRNGASSRE